MKSYVHICVLISIVFSNSNRNSCFGKPSILVGTESYNQHPTTVHTLGPAVSQPNSIDNYITTNWVWLPMSSTVPLETQVWNSNDSSKKTGCKSTCWVMSWPKHVHVPIFLCEVWARHAAMLRLVSVTSVRRLVARCRWHKTKGQEAKDWCTEPRFSWPDAIGVKLMK